MTQSQISRGINDLQRAIGLYRIWFYQGYHSISAKYKRSLLGPFWIAGSMVATSLSLALVFGGIFGQPLKEILPYITSGILVWTVISMPLTEAPETFVGSSHIIKNHAYPFMYYVIEMVCRNFLIFMHNIVVFFIVIACLRTFTPISWTLLPGIVMTYVTVTFYSALAAMIAARFRDIRFIFPYLAQILFFATPIFWRPELISGPRRAIADLNPLYHLLQLVRAPLLGGHPSLHDWASSGTFLLVGVVLWAIFFTAFRRRIAFWV